MWEVHTCRVYMHRVYMPVYAHMCKDWRTVTDVILRNTIHLCCLSLSWNLTARLSWMAG